MKLLEQIKHEHDQVRDIILSIENNEEQKRELFEQMVVAVLAHHEAEEEVAFDALPEDEQAQELREELIAEHDCLRRQFQVILDCEDDDKWMANFKVAKEIFTHHINEEEKELFAKLRDEYDEEALEDLYEEFENAEGEAKESTRQMLEEEIVVYADQVVPQILAQDMEEDTMEDDQQEDTQDNDDAQNTHAGNAQPAGQQPARKNKNMDQSSNKGGNPAKDNQKKPESGKQMNNSGSKSSGAKPGNDPQAPKPSAGKNDKVDKDLERYGKSNKKTSSK